MKVKITRAGIEQAGCLSDLAYRSKAYWGYSSDFMIQCKDELTYSADDISTHLFYCLELKRQVAGFYGLKAINEQHVELEALFVEPGLMGNGYGMMLINHAKQIAISHGYKKIMIQSDPHSLGFYQSAGAIEVGSEPSHSIAGRVLPVLELRL